MKWLRQLLCRHHYVFEQRRLEGVTLSWSGDPTRAWRMQHVCTRCGHRQRDGLFVVPNDRQLYPDAYGADGWPVDETGRRLPIAKA